MDLELLAYLRSFLTENRLQTFDNILKDRTRHFTVVTEDVYQIHNTSAVMRSCDVFGVQEVHVVEERFGKRVDKEIAMGAQKWVDLHRYKSIDDCIHTLKAKGYQIVATTPHKGAQFLHEFDIQPKSAFFFGTEKEGLSNKVLDNADVAIKIPMYGFTESLNISVSAAIILQDVVTRLKQSDVDWKISEKEKLELQLKWAKNTIKSHEQIIARFYNNKS